MTTTAPPNTMYGTVSGRFLQMVGDTSDLDSLVDAVPARGKVTFIAEVEYLLDPDGAPPATLIPTPVTCKLDDDGYLVDSDGNLGVALLATDGPLNPTDFTYQVTLAFRGEPARTFSMALPAGTTVDLTSVQPVASSPGNAITKGDKGDKGDQGDVGPNVTDEHLMEVMDGIYIPRTESTLGIDTDGVPFVNYDGVPLVSAGRILQDTDGVPYFEMV